MAGMKNIALSADARLIEAARRRAASEQTTLNDQFRRWLSGRYDSPAATILGSAVKASR